MSNTANFSVRGVPSFFNREWLAKNAILLWAVLGVVGVIDLLLALANLSLGDTLAVLVNLVTGVISVAAAVVIQGAWRPDSVMMDRVSIGCMVAMWVTAVWTAGTFIYTTATTISIVGHLGGSVNPGGIIFQGLFLTAYIIAMMMVYGTAATVVKSKTTTNTN